jgi:hypothetical protein
MDEHMMFFLESQVSLFLAEWALNHKLRDVEGIRDASCRRRMLRRH